MGLNAIGNIVGVGAGVQECLHAGDIVVERLLQQHSEARPLLRLAARRNGPLFGRLGLQLRVLEQLLRRTAEVGRLLDVHAREDRRRLQLALPRLIEL